MNHPRINPNTRILRHPSGHWVAIGSVPLGTSIFTVKEIIDERPFREMAMNRMGWLLTPQLHSAQIQLGCIGGVAPSDHAREEYESLFARTIAYARRASEVMVDRDVRTALMQKLGESIKILCDAAEASQKAHSKANGSVGAMPTAEQQMKRTLDMICQRLQGGDPSIEPVILQSAHAMLQGDPRAKKLMMDLVHCATWSDAGRRLGALFARSGLPNLAWTVQRQEAIHKQKLLARAASK